ncbi:hypothetical protein HDU82_000388 [Entophlyctis luteolus]|nr:hypothetical protein HDU82_000388 [Entophlyctis luteolus]
MAPSHGENVTRLVTGDSQGEAPLRIHFPSKATVASRGAKLTKKESQQEPSLTVAAAIIQPDTRAKSFICIALDLDAPFPSMPIMSPIVHWMITDLKLSTDREAGGFIPLVAAGEPLMFWAAPEPPPMSGPHRYIFLLWEQPEGMTAETARESLGFQGNIGALARTRWDQEAAESKLGLGKAIAGNYFVV